MPGEIAIDKRGTKLLLDSISRNKTPAEYLSVSKNARIKDQTITKRKGQKTVVESNIGTENKGITYNKELFVLADDKFQQVDLTAGTLTNKGSLITPQVVNFVNYGKYTLIFTGLGKPRHYDGTTLAQTTTTSPDVDPIIADRFTGFTFMAGNTADKENVLYISRPILEATQNYCYDRTGTDSEQITFDSKILGLISTLNQLFIFTENRIEYVSKESLQTVGGVATLISTPVGDGGQLASYRSVISAGDKVFYLTKNNTINTLNYASGTVDPAIGILTDEPVFKITKYLENLDSDQSGSFGYFNESDKTVQWFLKTQGALYNDTVLIYDIENTTWTTDTRKYYNDIITVNNLTYAGSSLSNNIIQDNIGLDDDNDAIEFEIHDTDISLGTIREKLFQGWMTSGGLNKSTNIEITTYIDNESQSLVTIDGDDYFGLALSPGSIGGAATGGTAIGGSISDYEEDFKQFDITLDHGNIYTRGKRIKRVITENSLGSDFYLDLYSILADVTSNIELNDIF